MGRQCRPHSTRRSSPGPGERSEPGRPSSRKPGAVVTAPLNTSGNVPPLTVGTMEIVCTSAVAVPLVVSVQPLSDTRKTSCRFADVNASVSAALTDAAGKLLLTMISLAPTSLSYPDRPRAPLSELIEYWTLCETLMLRDGALPRANLLCPFGANSGGL